VVHRCLETAAENDRKCRSNILSSRPIVWAPFVISARFGDRGRRVSTERRDRRPADRRLRAKQIGTYSWSISGRSTIASTRASPALAAYRFGIIPQA
jgi:hypothetical protein